MNFKEIIKQEWEKEFPSEGIQGYPENPESYERIYEDSIFTMYESMVQRICIKVWNQALDIALDNIEVICDSSETFQSIDDNSILQYKINEQGTDTTT